MSEKFAVYQFEGRKTRMNVLNAEANLPYDIAFEKGKINSVFKANVLVIGANDIVNSEALND